MRRGPYYGEHKPNNRIEPFRRFPTRPIPTLGPKYIRSEFDPLSPLHQRMMTQRRNLFLLQQMVFCMGIVPLPSSGIGL